MHTNGTLDTILNSDLLLIWLNKTCSAIQADLDHISEKLPFDATKINISVMWLPPNSPLTSE